jgi:hypothetical protein
MENRQQSIEEIQFQFHPFEAIDEDLHEVFVHYCAEDGI